MEKIRVCRALGGLFEDICRLEAACFSIPWSREAVKAAFENEAVATFAVLFDDKICGFAMISTAADESELLNLAVDAEYRNRGFAKALLERAEEEAVDKGAGVMYLEVRESNEAAKNLYTGFGFSEIGRRKKYYRFPTEDAIMMAKDLKRPEI